MEYMKKIRDNRRLIIIGASGHGKVIADIAIKMNKWSKIFFLDDDPDIKTSLGIDVIGKSTEALRFINDYAIFVAIGDNKTREQVQKHLVINGAIVPTLIHPSATIGEMVELGSGTAVMAGTVINSCSKIGEGCIVNTGSTIDHDNSIGDFVHISPGVHLAGTVNIGNHTWLGIGSMVVNNVSIAGNCVIGAGSVVINNLTESGTYVGVPAIQIR